MIYNKATLNDIKGLSTLVSNMFTSNNSDELNKVLTNYIRNKESEIFICKDEENIIGLAMISLRHEHVEGCNVYPVAYIEGIYIKEEYENGDIAKSLLSEAEKWAKDNGACQMASDCELDNLESYSFHIACGFSQVRQITCFKKEIQ